MLDKVATYDVSVSPGCQPNFPSMSHQPRRDLSNVKFAPSGTRRTEKPPRLNFLRMGVLHYHQFNSNIFRVGPAL